MREKVSKDHTVYRYLQGKIRMCRRTKIMVVHRREKIKVVEGEEK